MDEIEPLPDGDGAVADRQPDLFEEEIGAVGDFAAIVLEVGEAGRVLDQAQTFLVATQGGVCLVPPVMSRVMERCACDPSGK